MKESRGGKQLAMKKGKRKSKRNNVPTITQARRRIRGKKTDLLYDGNWYLERTKLGSKGSATKDKEERSRTNNDKHEGTL